MGRHNPYQSRAKMDTREVKIHPIWRGIGFILILLTPIMSYAATDLLLKANTENNWVPIPKELWSPVLDRMLFVKIILTISFMVVIYGIFMLLSFALYRFLGPSRYGPYDVPPVGYRGRPYKR